MRGVRKEEVARVVCVCAESAPVRVVRGPTCRVTCARGGAFGVGRVCRVRVCRARTTLPTPSRSRACVRVYREPCDETEPTKQETIGRRRNVSRNREKMYNGLSSLTKLESAAFLKTYPPHTKRDTHD